MWTCWLRVATLAALLAAPAALRTPLLTPRGAAHSDALAAARAPPVRAEVTVAADDLVVTCSRCKATYVIDKEAFGEGKQVKCTTCKHEWYQATPRLQKVPPDMVIVEYPQEMKDRIAAGKPAEAVGRFRVFVGNLAFDATEDDLRELFGRYGTVVSVSVMADDTGRPKGFAFVNMESIVAGAKAVEELNGEEFCGRSITVSEGKQSAGGGRGRGRGDGRGRGRGDGRGRGRGRGGGRGGGRGSWD